MRATAPPSSAAGGLGRAAAAMGGRVGRCVIVPKPHKYAMTETPSRANRHSNPPRAYAPLGAQWAFAKGVCRVGAARQGSIDAATVAQPTLPRGWVRA
jgi:hypothetical protein